MRFARIIAAALFVLGIAALGRAQIVTSSPPALVSLACTPGIAFGGAAVGVTYSPAPLGTCSQQANMVCVQLYFVTSSKGSSVGTAAVTGLPVASKNMIQALTLFSSTGLTYSGPYLEAQTVNSATAKLYTTQTVTGAGQLADTNFNNVTDIGIGGCYFTS